jgi:hypothetical protein
VSDPEKGFLKCILFYLNYWTSGKYTRYESDFGGKSFNSMIKFFVLDVLLRQVVAVSSDPAPDSAFAPPFFGRPSGQLP